MGFKPFGHLADIIADKQAKQLAIIEAKKRAKVAKIQATKIRNKQFREKHIQYFLDNIQVEYSIKHDYVRIISRETMEIREYPNFLSNHGMSSIYGGINYCWFNTVGGNISIGRRLFKKVIEECGNIIQ